MTANNTEDSEMPRNAIHGSELHLKEGSNLPKAQKKMLQTLDGFGKTGLESNKNKTDVNKYVKGSQPATHQYIVGYDSISDSTYLNIPHVVNKTVKHPAEKRVNS